MKIEINSGMEPNMLHGLINEILMIGYILIAVLSPLHWLTIVAIVLAAENLLESIIYSVFAHQVQQERKEKNGSDR